MTEPTNPRTEIARTIGHMLPLRPAIVDIADAIPSLPTVQRWRATHEAVLAEPDMPETRTYSGPSWDNPTEIETDTLRVMGAKSYNALLARLRAVGSATPTEPWRESIINRLVAEAEADEGDVPAVPVPAEPAVVEAARAVVAARGNNTPYVLPLTVFQIWYTYRDCDYRKRERLLTAPYLDERVALADAAAMQDAWEAEDEQERDTEVRYFVRPATVPSAPTKGDGQ